MLTIPVYIRKTTTKDIGRLQEIFGIARQFMADTGNAHQWAADYPSEALIGRDINQGDSYVCVCEDKVVGTFVMRSGKDPTYDVIYSGAWIDDGPYVTIHRIASSGDVHGLFGYVMQYATERYRSIRIDTHADNRVMQHIITKAGFHYCGIIHCWNGSERLAYQYIRDTY